MRIQHVSMLFAALCGCQTREGKVTTDIEDQLRQRFKDPKSVRFRNIDLFRQAIRERSSLRVMAYSLCGEFEAKDQSGAYGGFRRFSSMWFLKGDGTPSRDPGSLFLNIESASMNRKERARFEEFYLSDCRDEQSTQFKYTEQAQPKPQVSQLPNVSLVCLTCTAFSRRADDPISPV